MDATGSRFGPPHRRTPKDYSKYRCPHLPAPVSAIGFSGKCGLRGIITGEYVAKPLGLLCASFVESVCAQTKRRLFVCVSAERKVVAGHSVHSDRSLPELRTNAGDLLGESAAGVCDCHRVRCSEGPQAAGRFRPGLASRGGAGALM